MIVSPLALALAVSRCVAYKFIGSFFLYSVFIRRDFRLAGCSGRRRGCRDNRQESSTGSVSSSAFASSQGCGVSGQSCCSENDNQGTTELKLCFNTRHWVPSAKWKENKWRFMQRIWQYTRIRQLQGRFSFPSPFTGSVIILFYLKLSIASEQAYFWVAHASAERGEQEGRRA